MYLKDKTNRDEHIVHPHSHHGATPSSGGKIEKSSDSCKRYNRGKCHKGASCKYQHKCDECGKYEHGAHICRK